MFIAVLFAFVNQLYSSKALVLSILFIQLRFSILLYFYYSFSVVIYLSSCRLQEIKMNDLLLVSVVRINLMKTMILCRA